MGRALSGSRALDARAPAGWHMHLGPRHPALAPRSRPATWLPPVASQGVYYGGLPSAADMVRSGLAAPSDFKLLLGLAGWAPGQLASEVDAGVWHCVAASRSVIMPRSGEGSTRGAAAAAAGRCMLAAASASCASMVCASRSSAATHQPHTRRPAYHLQAARAPCGATYSTSSAADGSRQHTGRLRSGAPRAL